MCSPQKKKMHDRNIFRNPPDYTELAIKYKDFREVCNLELSGKVSIDYKKENVLPTLTKTLLLEYFQLDVEFAPESLIPTLPLRLNYILWLEDLINSNEEINTSNVFGIDIGCGSSCIYSLLAAKKNGWHMYALESSETNIQFANDNVERNNLKNLITIFEQKDSTIIFKRLFEALPNQYFQFCICNPPFYDSTVNLQYSNTRNPDKRAPPPNYHTGRNEELACEGGEVSFVQCIIEESLQFSTRISIFTTMLGHKSSVFKIIEILKRLQIVNYCTTEFHQGRTTRWGIAWSLNEKIELKKF